MVVFVGILALVLVAIERRLRTGEGLISPEVQALGLTSVFDLSADPAEIRRVVPVDYPGDRGEDVVTESASWRGVHLNGLDLDGVVREGVRVLVKRARCFVGVDGIGLSDAGRGQRLQALVAMI